MSFLRLAFGTGDEAIHGNKVVLRRPRLGHFEEWKALRQTSRKHLEMWEPTWDDNEFSRSAFRQRVNAYNERAANDEGHSFYLFHNETDALVGGLTLSYIRRGVSQSGTLGYWTGEPYVGMGLMKDAILALITVAKSRFALHRLEAACIPHNDRSRYLLLACGFEAEGYAKAYVKIAGQWEDHLLFGRVLD